MSCKPHSDFRRSGPRVLAATMSTLFLWAPAGAIRFDWSDAEVQCAQTVGVELRDDARPGSHDYVKRLAWLSDLIVFGTVGKIRHDIHGAYHTQVPIKVLSVRKGRLPGGRLTVALTSGPVFVPSLGQVLEARAVDEPTFASGETVLLFLTKGHIETTSPSGPSYDLPEHFFCPVNDAKLLIDGTTAKLQGWGVGDYNVIRADYEIRQVVEAQSTNCE